MALCLTTVQPRCCFAALTPFASLALLNSILRRLRAPADAQPDMSDHGSPEPCDVDPSLASRSQADPKFMVLMVKCKKIMQNYGAEDKDIRHALPAPSRGDTVCCASAINCRLLVQACLCFQHR